MLLYNALTVFGTVWLMLHVSMWLTPLYFIIHYNYDLIYRVFTTQV